MATRYYIQAAVWAVEHGITTGVDCGEFDSDVSALVCRMQRSCVEIISEIEAFSPVHPIINENGEDQKPSPAISRYIREIIKNV